MQTVLRVIVTMFWAVIFCLIIGFIAGALTQMKFNPTQCVIVGAIFGCLYALIIPTITAHSVKDKSKYSKI
ncbi:MAG: YjzD family protein [Lactobacillus sp.]|nr:YjzD family protein [Lactobacillus sp.]